jgi:hypothetical protein
MLTIPLNAVPNQRLTSTINSQGVQINVYQKRYGLFFDLYLNNVAVVTTVMCENLNRLVRNTYLGFVGDLLFLDSQPRGPVVPPHPYTGYTLPPLGSLEGSDPFWEGLGDRFHLIYLYPSELTALGVPTLGS